MTHLLDACALLNLSNGGVLDSALSLPGSFIVCSAARRESKTIRSVIDHLVIANRLKFMDDHEIPASLFLKLKQQHGLGDGETECLAVASISSGILVFDDQRARKIATSLFGAARVTGSIGILRSCVSNGILSRAEAYGAYTLMKALGAYLPDMTINNMFP